jgi:hypothetical protein
MRPRQETAAEPSAFPALAAAAERHLAWATEYVRVGDLESALFAFADLRCICEEVCPEST